MIIEEFKIETRTPSYTFQDWLDDDIDYEMNAYSSLIEEPRALYAAKWISEEDYKKIIECQVRAYDTAVEETFNTFIWDFLKNYNNSPYKTEYLVNEIKTAQEIIDKNPKEMYHVLAGQKDFTKICGGRCQEIMERKNKTGHHFFYRDNDNMRMTAQYKYLKWLECFKDNAKPPHKETLKISIRRAVAFCIYILYDSEKYDILDMRQSTIKEIINNDFSDNTGKPLAGVQTTTDTLLGFRANGRPKEKALFIYDEYADGRKGWEKLPENFEEMIKMFPDDYNKALELLERFK